MKGVHTNCFEEACLDMVDDIRQSNKANGSTIPQRFVAGLEQMVKDSSAIDNSIMSRLSTLQDLHLHFVLLETPKESPTPPVEKQTPKKRKRG
jgi:hypothetical protein